MPSMRIALPVTIVSPGEGFSRMIWTPAACVVHGTAVAVAAAVGVAVACENRSAETALGPPASAVTNTKTKMILTKTLTS